ncbi:hypothetical protein CF54_23180 [Streptomyces sp. Tu 6176]|uniref:hypothetical protein n=1 Tax=Streptomyces sp. Tu 6176 TaxID=1470557 RepID=UPI00044F6A8F|nr:hypothetical protein [Streptomyces sp. Tu 6176]EYT80841.1 hypothetical protein CF54_23180 [Streptomyces sp. Tu 6176]
MISIDFDCETMRELSAGEVEGAVTANEMDIRYGYFETDISFSVDGQWGESFFGVPIVDFMFCLLLSARAVQEGGVGKISFTENDMTMGIVSVEGGLDIVRSWDPVVGRYRLGDFTSQVSAFVDRGLACILDKHPEFESNPTYLKILGLR